MRCMLHSLPCVQRRTAVKAAHRCNASETVALNSPTLPSVVARDRHAADCELHAACVANCLLAVARCMGPDCFPWHATHRVAEIPALTDHRRRVGAGAARIGVDRAVALLRAILHACMPPATCRAHLRRLSQRATASARFDCARAFRAHKNAPVVPFHGHSAGRRVTLRSPLPIGLAMSVCSRKRKL